MLYDYIIIGAGIAGLNAARLIPKDKKVLILCKKALINCNTYWAQGGVASALDKEDIALHVKDTMKAGAFSNDEKAVTLLSSKSKEVINSLINDGIKFDLNEDGTLAFTKEAAHSKNRILHADGDATGRMIHEFLFSKCNHEIQNEVVVCDLLIQDDICYGVQYFVNETEQKIAYANNTIIASGGLGSLYRYHTNSTVISGEVQGIIAEKNLNLKDMEMIQFHPTVVRGTSFARKPLLSEALRGEGATIEDDEGNRFLFLYHEDGELAPRDVVSRSIFQYHNKTKKNIYLCFKNFEKEAFQKRFPNIYKNLKDLGYDLPSQKVPISPAFHYAMGGIETTLDAKVKGMKNLYAIGESACTGVHGANRLASNSLLEGLVFSSIAVEDSLANNFVIKKENYKNKIINYTRNQEIDKKIKNHLRNIMWESAGIVRNTKDMEKSLQIIDDYLKEDVGRLLFLRLITAKSILFTALKRKTSLGAHFIKEN